MTRRTHATRLMSNVRCSSSEKVLFIYALAGLVPVTSNSHLTKGGTSGYIETCGIHDDHILEDIFVKSYSLAILTIFVVASAAQLSAEVLRPKSMKSVSSTPQ